MGCYASSTPELELYIGRRHLDRAEPSPRLHHIRSCLLHQESMPPPPSPTHADDLSSSMPVRPPFNSLSRRSATTRSITPPGVRDTRRVKSAPSQHNLVPCSLLHSGPANQAVGRFGSRAIFVFFYFQKSVNPFKYCTDLQIFIEICTKLRKFQNKFHLNPFREIYTVN
jgi:hypothetical protein